MDDKEIEPEDIEEQLRLDFEKTFGTESGDRVLNHMIGRFAFATTTYDDSPYMMYFKEGQRTTVLYILSQLGEAPRLTEIKERLNRGRTDYWANA
jgi:hypothetical protein